MTGRSVREISEQLVVSESTVHTHLTHVYRKLGIRSRLDLLALAVQSGDAATPASGTSNKAPRAERLPSGIVLGAAVAVVSTVVGVVMPVSTIIIGPGLLLIGVTAGRAESDVARRASLPLLVGGLLCTLLAAGALLAVRVT
jgi:hypothetical protein